MQGNFTMYRFNDGILTVPIAPPTAIGSWDIRFTMTKRQGGTAIISKSVASGFNGQSGITILNSGTGTFYVSLSYGEMSGLDQGSYAYEVARYDSGSHSVLATGYRLSL